MTLRSVTWPVWFAWGAAGALAGLCFFALGSSTVLVLVPAMVAVALMAWKFPPSREAWGFLSGVSTLPLGLALQSPSCALVGGAECPSTGPLWLVLPAAGFILVGLALTALKSVEPGVSVDEQRFEKAPTR